MGNPEQHTSEHTSHDHSHHDHIEEQPRNKRKKGPTDNPTDLSEQMVAETLRTRKSNCSHSCGKGDCGSDSGCSTGGCGKGSLLELIATNFTYSDERHIVEVSFPGNRKGFAFFEDPEMILRVRDVVVVEHESGQEWAVVSMTGSLVHAKRKAKRLSGEELPVILRLADPTDAKKIEQGKASSRQAYSVCKTRIESFELPMELVDAEWQFDRKKLTFYFTADGRIDFRALVRDLAAIFNTRIELRQIAVRDAAKRLGGVGICGLELCCTTFLGRYEHITLDHAKIQQIPANPSKLSGQCGRLKCCLLYEIDTYVEGMKRFPPIESTVKTTVGVGSVQKIDLFKEVIWLYHVESSSWESLTLQQYKDFRAGKMPKPEAPPEPVKSGYSASEPQRSSDKSKQGDAGSSEAKAKEQSKNKRGDSSSRRSGKKRGANVEGRVENQGESQEQAKPTTEEKGRSNNRKKGRKGGSRRAKGERPKGEGGGAPKVAATAKTGNPEGKGNGA